MRCYPYLSSEEWVVKEGRNREQECKLTTNIIGAILKATVIIIVLIPTSDLRSYAYCGETGEQGVVFLPLPNCVNNTWDHPLKMNSWTKKKVKHFYTTYRIFCHNLHWFIHQQDSKCSVVDGVTDLDSGEWFESPFGHKNSLGEWNW